MVFCSDFIIVVELVSNYSTSIFLMSLPEYVWGGNAKYESKVKRFHNKSYDTKWSFYDTTVDAMSAFLG